jgi:hypothetical protein
VMLAGGPSPFGTIGQAGNVDEWEETEGDLLNDTTNTPRGIRGGDWTVTLSTLGQSSSYRGVIFPPGGHPINVGFRVISVLPEPGTTCIAAMAVFPICLRFRRRKSPHRIRLFRFIL